MNGKLWRIAPISLFLTLAAFTLMTTVYAPAFAQVDDQNVPIEPLSSTGEGSNRVLTSNWRDVTPDEQHIYRVDYDGNEQPIRVWMNVSPTNAAQFEIWTDDSFYALETEPDQLPLATGAPLADGSEFLLWQGSNLESEVFYIRINTTGADAAQYMLNISSPALSAIQPGVTQQQDLPPTPFPPTETPAFDPNAVTPTVPLPADPNAVVPTATPNVIVVTATPTVASGAIDPSLAGTTQDTGIAIVTTAMLNVRTGPSTAYPVITAVPNGTSLTVLGRNEANTWIAVRLADGTEGWVTRSLTNYVTLAAVVITPGPPPTPTLSPGLTPVPAATNVATENSSIVVVEAGLPKTLDGSWQVLREGETHWYTFQYRGGGLPVHVWMDVEPSEGAVFNILNQQTALSILAGVAPSVVNAIGRGTANPVEPGYLFWRDSFPEADILYVMVQHRGPGDALYSIYAAGPGLGRPVPQ